MKSLITLFLGLFAATLPAAASAAEVVTIPDCLVSLIEDIQVPAQEAGVLLEVYVREGAGVEKGRLLAQIDDAHARMQLQVAEFDLKVAVEKAANDTNIEYARAASEVAKSEYDRALEAIRRIPGSVPPAEVDRLRLTWRRTLWEIEQAKMDKSILGLESKVAEAKVRAAEESLRRRKISAPINAEVEEVLLRKGEWVQPGDPVLHIMQVDLLRVEGFLNVRDIHGSDVLGRPVQVSVELERGQFEQFVGRLVFVSHFVQPTGEYKVRAEVQNRRAGDAWLLSPGLPAKMTIQLK